MSNEISLHRKVTVYNTSAQNNKVIESAAVTWGQLQQELAEAGIPYSGMRAVVGETQTELITNQSSLDPGDVTLFLMPRKVKSGISILGIVDPSNGVSFSDKDWTDEDPQGYTFRTVYDAALAFLSRANFLSAEGNDYSNKAAAILSQVSPPSIAVGTLSSLEEVDDGDDDYSDDDYDNGEDENYEEEPEELETSPGIWNTAKQNTAPYPVDNDWGFELSPPLDPEVERLKKQAEELQRNMR
jgi:hypothetical protein